MTKQIDKSKLVRLQLPTPGVAGEGHQFEPRMDYDFGRVVSDRKNFPMGSGEAISTALTRNHAEIIRMVRSAVRMNGLAARAVDVPTDYVVGTGIRPSIPDDDRDLMKLWNRWTKHAGAEGIGNFYAVQRLAYRERRTTGEVFPYLRLRKGEKAKTLPVPLQIQILQSEMVPTHTPFAPKAKGGILRTVDGDPESYYVFKNHPGEKSKLVADYKRETFKVPATLLKHVCIRKEAGAIRGEPSIARALLKIHDLDQYLGSELVRKVNASFISYWMELPPLSEEEKERLADVFYNPEDQKYYNSEGMEVAPPQTEDLRVDKPGTVMAVPAGGKINQTAPAESGNTFVPFVRQICLQISAALNIPIEYLLYDLSAGNDRVFKGVSQMFERSVNAERDDFNAQFNNPIWNAFVKLAIAEGKWSVPEGRTEEDFLDPEWVGQPLPNLHKAQEISSWKEEVNEGFATQSDIVRGKGDDPERVRREKLDDLKKNIEAGLEPVPAHWTDKAIKNHLGWDDEEIASYRSLTVQ